MSRELTTVEPETLDPKPETVDVRDSMRIIMQAESLASPDDYVAMGTALVVLKRKISAIEEWYEPRKRKARMGWESYCADERDALKPVKAAVDHASRLLAAWDNERRRLAEAEAARLLAERRAVETEQALATAITLTEAGEAYEDPELLFQAEETLAQAAVGTVPVPVGPARTSPFVAGLSMKPEWEPSVLDLGKMFEAAARNPVLRSIFKLDQAEFRRFAKLYKGNLSRVLPGATATLKSKPRTAR